MFAVFYIPRYKEYTWTNNALTRKSQIDFWLLSTNAVQFVSDTSIGYSPLSDHRLNLFNWKYRQL